MNFVTYSENKVFPTKVVCIGRNYAAHIAELNNAIPEEPVIFIKPNSAIAGAICVDLNEDIHYEGEISFLIKNKKISAVGFGLDLTKRSVQSNLKQKGLPWERAKAFDGSAVFSEFVSFDHHEIDIEDLRLELFINGYLLQQGGYELMLYKPDEIIREVSSFMALEDNDILMTGTPAGVGKLLKGDVFEAKVFSDDVLLLSQAWTVEMKKGGGAK